MKSFHSILALLMAAYVPLWCCCAGLAMAAADSAAHGAPAAGGCAAQCTAPTENHDAPPVEHDPASNPKDCCDQLTAPAYTAKTAAAAAGWLLQPMLHPLPSPIPGMASDAVASAVRLPDTGGTPPPAEGSLLSRHCLLLN